MLPNEEYGKENFLLSHKVAEGSLIVEVSDIYTGSDETDDLLVLYSDILQSVSQLQCSCTVFRYTYRNADNAERSKSVMIPDGFKVWYNSFDLLNM